MANTVFKLRRSSVAGKKPTTSDIAIGELALNLTDRKLYSSDGSNVWELGANLSSISVSNTTATFLNANSSSVYVGNNLILGNSSVIVGLQANGGYGTSGQVLTSNGTATYWSTLSADVNTAIQYNWTNNHTFSANLTVLNGARLIIANGASLYANGSSGVSGQVLASNGSSYYWISPSDAGLPVRQQNTGDGVTTTFSVAGG